MTRFSGQAFSGTLLVKQIIDLQYTSTLEIVVYNNKYFFFA